VEEYAEKGLLTICGDITDSVVQELVNLPYAKLIISTVPDFNDNLSLVHAIRHQARKMPKLIFIAQDETETKMLYKEGIDYVISPHFMGGMHLAKILGGRDRSFGLKKLRQDHLEILTSNGRKWEKPGREPRAFFEIFTLTLRTRDLAEKQN